MNPNPRPAPINARYHCLEITTAIGCKNMCSYCPQKLLLSKYKGEKTLSMDNFKKALSNTPKEVRLRFAGFVEPFQNPEASDMMVHAIREGYHVAVYTTFTDFRQSDYNKIKDLDFEFFHVHDIGQDRKHMEYPFIDEWIPAGNGNVNNRAGNLDFSPVYCENPTGCTHTVGYHNNIMLPNGDVAVCCADYGLTNIIGNIYTQNYYNLNRTWDRELCKKCVYAR